MHTSLVPITEDFFTREVFARGLHVCPVFIYYTILRQTHSCHKFWLFSLDYFILS